MRAKGLIDTGVIVGILNVRDTLHEQCARAYEAATLPLLTSHAVLTELFHLLDQRPGAVATAWSFIRHGGIQVATLEHSELPAIEELMIKYADRPMDFANATLVYLARREGLSSILTVDRNDFETYRISGNKRFHISPAIPGKS